MHWECCLSKSSGRRGVAGMLHRVSWGGRCCLKGVKQASGSSGVHMQQIGAGKHASLQSEGLSVSCASRLCEVDLAAWPLSGQHALCCSGPSCPAVSLLLWQVRQRGAKLVRCIARLGAWRVLASASVVAYTWLTRLSTG